MVHDKRNEYFLTDVVPFPRPADPGLLMYLLSLVLELS